MLVHLSYGFTLKIEKNRSKMSLNTVFNRFMKKLPKNRTFSKRKHRIEQISFFFRLGSADFFLSHPSCTALIPCLEGGHLTSGGVSSYGFLLKNILIPYLMKEILWSSR